MTRSVKSRPATVLLLGLLGLFFVPFVLAQEPDAPTDVAETAVEAPPFEVPEGLSNARATMRTFLEAFDENLRDPDRTPLEQAASCLDLRSMREDLRSRQGQELAQQLKEILDRTVLIDFDRIPDRKDGRPWTLDVPDAGEVTLAADSRGVWLFTPETVDDIPELFRRTANRQKVEGVTDVVPLTPALWLRSQMPESLLEVGFLLEHWQWLGLLCLLFLGLILDRLLTRAAQGTIERHLEQRTESVDPDDLRHALRPLGLLISALLWWAGIFWLGLDTRILEVLLVAIHFVAAVSFVGVAYRMVDVVAAVLDQRASRTQNKFDDLLVPLFRKSMKLLVATLGLVFIAETLSLPLRSVIAGVGIGGLALALAAQDVVKNLFGSLMVIIDRPFAVGDWVTIEGVEGTVAELGFRSTRIRTFYDSIVTVPNSNLISASVDNYGRRRFRRWRSHLSLTYDTSPQKIEAFCEGVRELIRLDPDTRKDYFEVHLNRFSASSLDVLLYVFFTTPDWSGELAARHRLGNNILRLAADLEVEFAFPTQTVHLMRPSSSSDLPPSGGYDRQLKAIHEEARERARRLQGDETTLPSPGEAGAGGVPMGSAGDG